MNAGTGSEVPHILILEDDAAHRDLILRAFRDDPDKFRLSVAGTLRSAREIFERDRPDLILSDWILPDGKGLDILPRTDGLVTIPLIIMTSFGDERLAVEIMKSGAIDYVVKSATMFRDLPHIARRALADWENILERKRAEAAVQDTQKRIADILNFLPDAVLAIDNDGRVIGWNHTIERMTGVMAADMLGKGDHEHSLPFYGERRPILIDLVLMDDVEIEKKYDYIQRDNGRITSETFIPGLFGGKGAYLWGTASPLFDLSGNRTGAIEVIRDITERKHAEHILQESEKKYRFLIDNVRDIVWQTMPDLTFTYVSPAAEPLTGYLPKDLIGTSLFAILTEPSSQVVQQRLRERMEDYSRGSRDMATIFEAEIRKKDGNPIWLEISSTAVFGPDGTIAGFQGISRDITDRKQAELALQESEERFRHISSLISDFAYSCTRPPDGAFSIDWISGAVRRITGFSEEEILAMGCWRGIVAEEDYSLFDENIARLLPGMSSRSELRIRAKDGANKWLQCFTECVSDPASPGIHRLYGGCRDITDKRIAENTLRDSETRFRDLFSNMSSGVAIYEPTPDGEDFIIRDVNRAVETIERVKKDEIVGKSVLEVFPGVVEFGLFAVFQRVARTGVAEAFPVSMYHDIRIAGWRENYIYKLPSGEVVALYEDVTEKKQAEEAVLESRRKYAELFELGSETIVLVDNETGSILEANAAAGEMYGYSRDVLLSMKNTDLSAEQEETRHVTTETPQGSIRIPLRYHRRSDGTVFPVEILGRFFVWNKRSVHIAAIRDITSRVQAEKALRESEERYRSVIENAAEGITVVQDSVLQYANSHLLEMIQAHPEDIANRPFTDFIHPDDRAFVLGRHQRRIAGENPAQNYDFRILGKKGKVVWVQLSAVRIEWNDRPATLNFLMDITDRKQAEERLRESRQILEGILNTIPVRVFWKDKNLTYLGCNTPFAHDAGFEIAEDIIGKDDYAMAWRDQAELYQADDRAVIESGNAKLMIEEPQTTPAGDTIYLLTSKLPLRDARGDVIGVLGTYLDITDRKKAEEMLRESEERYRALLNGAGLGVGYWGLDGTLLFLNEISFKRLRGTESDFIGKNMRELFGENAEMYLDRIRKAADSPDPTEYEDFVSLPVGKGWYLSVYTRICRPDGSVMGIQVLSMDITQRKQAEEIRKAYESRLDSAMEIGSLAWWEMDLPDGAVRFDDRKATMLGYPPAQFTHYRDFTALLHPDDFEPAMQAMKDHLEDRQSRYHTDYRIRTAAGDYRWFRDVGGITRHHPDGSPATVTGIVIDITASRLAEEALRATETRYRALIQNSSDIIRILDRDGLIVYESGSAERILGYPRGYLVGKNPMEYIHPEDLEHVKNDFGEVIDRVNPGIPTEFRIRKADGEYIWVDSIGTNLLDMPGVNGIVITTRPIQQRKEAEQALRESESRLATAMDIAGLVNWEFDVASGMFTFDDRFYAMYDTTAEREGGNLMSVEAYLQEFVHPDDRPAVVAAIHNLLATTDPEYSGQIEYRITPRDGSVRTIIARFAPVMGPDGKVIRTFGANQDITDFKLMESEIRSLNTVLEQRVKDRTEALAKTNEALEAEITQRQEAEKKLKSSYDEKVLLLKEIHHRVKNNLQIIASLLNLQSRYIKDESTLATIRESQNRVKAMALVHEKLYRSEDISHISLNDYLKFLGTGLFKFYDARSRGIQFRLEIHDVNVDINSAIPLGLIINELISNSLKYAFPEGRTGEIAISVTKEEHTLTIIFRDTGVGIPAELDWQNTQSLGLRLVNTLVDQMTGTIELDRSTGTQFTMVMHEKEQRESS